MRRLVLIVCLCAVPLLAMSRGLEGARMPAAATHAAAADDPVPPDAMAVSPDLQIPLLLKVLTYDRHFENRAATELNICIVYAPGNAASASAMTAISGVFRTFSDKTVKNLVIRHASVGFTNEVALARFAQLNKVNVFYIAPGNAQNLETLLRISGGQQIITTTGVPDYVERGVAVGIGVRQDKPQILINLASSKSAGIEFDASLLRIARVIR
jgi:YfiR/HmsC-like